jgi:hypothetical protein
MSSIGFRSSTLDELEVLAAMAIEDGAPMFTSDGTYFAWSDQSGAELWAQLSAGEEFLGVNPHFKHELTTRLRIESLRRRRTDSAMERLASAWVEDDSHPVLFDVPDAGAYRSLPLPTVADVQLVALPTP